MDVGFGTYPEYIAITAASCAVIFGIIGTLGNLLTIFAFFECKKLRNKPTTMLILNLAVSDLLLSVVSLPLLALEYLTTKYSNGLLCKIFPIMHRGNFGVSLLSLMAISLNRYYLIVKPQIYRKLYTTGGTIIMIIAIWITSFLLLLPAITEFWGKLGYDEKLMNCGIIKTNENEINPRLAIIIFGFLMPCIVMCYTYTCLYFKLRKNNKKISKHSQLSRRDNEERKVTLLMFTIFISFLLCFLPAMLVKVIDTDRKYPILHVAAAIFSWASVIINPFIYVATNKHYRRVYKQFFSNGTDEDIRSLRNDGTLCRTLQRQQLPTDSFRSQNNAINAVSAPASCCI